MRMKAAPFFVVLLLSVSASSAHAAGVMSICYNYGCSAESLVVVSDSRLESIHALLTQAHDAETERQALAEAIGRLYRIAGEQTPVAADRGGNYLDHGVEGRMDCIDHSTSTTRLLRLIEARGWLRFHRVLEPVRRTRLGFILQHFSAAIEETVPPAASAAAVSDGMPAQCDCADAAGGVEIRSTDRFVVDSWFVDNGEPAVILPLADWLNGEGPNVQ